MITKILEYMILERDELRKDIEQLCMQQAGPGYLAVATRMHFQRYLFILFIFLLLSGNLCTIEYLFIYCIDCFEIHAQLGQLDWSRRLRASKISWLCALETV
jgi:hypothetical protein